MPNVRKAKKEKKNSETETTTKSNKDRKEKKDTHSPVVLLLRDTMLARRRSAFSAPNLLDVLISRPSRNSHDGALLAHQRHWSQNCLLGLDGLGRHVGDDGMLLLSLGARLLSLLAVFFALRLGESLLRRRSMPTRELGYSRSCDRGVSRHARCPPLWNAAEKDAHVRRETRREE